MSGCERVQHRLLCNLTEALSDPMQTYITVVRAVLDEQASEPAYASRFKPLDHMSPPLLTVTPCGRDLCVDLQPPVERYREAYDMLSYHLHIESSGKDDAQRFIKTRSLRGQTLKDLTPGTQYCVSVSFWDILEETKSNFSTPVCAFTAGVTSADPWIAAVLCLLVIAAVISVSLLAFAGFICLKNRALPSVLASIRHLEENLAATCSTSLSSLWNVKPCDAEKTSSSSSADHGDQEFATEDSAQSTGSAYQLREGGATGLLSSSASSSCQPEPTHSDSSVQRPELFVSAPRSHRSADPWRADEEEEDLDEEGDGQDVNLLSLRLGRFEDMENKEKLHSAEEEPPESPAPLSPGWCTEEGASGTASGCSDEEEPDSDSGYTRRPKTDVFPPKN